MRRTAFVVAIVLTSSSLSAQSTPTLQQLLDRMGAYLLQYEDQLSDVVADERFTQRMSVRTGRSDSRTVQRFIESEVAFWRPPGGTEWLGFRDVRRVDARPVAAASSASLTALLTSGADGITQAKAMALAGAAHNLGLFRTLNFPSMPLDIVHPRHRQALRHWLNGSENVRGMSTTIVAFEETARPTIVRQPDATNVVSKGKVWIETATGRVGRIEWVYVLPQNATAHAVLPPRLRVEFAVDPGLAMLVPAKMQETFATSETGINGEGEAVYSNFRRFGTSARIVPQQP